MPRKFVVFAVLVLLTVVLGSVVSRGCEGSATEDVPTIRTPAEFNAANERAAQLAAERMVRWGQGQELSDQDLVALKTAANLYEGMIRFDPTIYRTYLAAGGVQQALGNDEQALKYFEQFLAFVPEKPDETMEFLAADVYNQRAQSFFRLKRFEESVQSSTKAIDIFQKVPEYRFTRASALAQLGKKAEAVKDLREALEEDPSHSASKSLLKMLTSGDL